MDKKGSKKKKQLDPNELAAKIVGETTEEKDTQKANSPDNNQPHQKK